MITLVQTADGSLGVAMTKRGRPAMASVLKVGESMVVIFPGLDVRIEVSKPRSGRGPKLKGAFYDEAFELFRD